MGKSWPSRPHFNHSLRQRLMQTVVELVGSEEAAFVEQFADCGKAGGGDGIAGAITVKHQQAARCGMLAKQKGRGAIGIGYVNPTACLFLLEPLTRDSVGW